MIQIGNNNKFVNVLLRGCFYLLLGSCITPYDFSSTQFVESIVVQGMITNQPGPYLVNVTRSIPVNNQLEDSGIISGVTVVINDDQGNSENLVEKTPGNFYTSSFQGVIGRSYTITVTTSEGNIYQSASEKLLPVGDIIDLRYEFKQNEPENANQQITSTNGFTILINGEVLPEQEGRMWWRWTGIYHIFTYPSLRTTLESGAKGAIAVTPAPRSCSGYNLVKGVLHGPNSECTCCDCWVTEYNQNALISDPKFISNGQITNYNIGFIEANRRTMYDKYILEVEQLSISQDIYNFWKTINVQKSNGSNLFQTPPPKTGGNMTALTPNAIPVIGYFAASAIKKGSLELNKSYVPYNIFPIDTIADSCIGVYKNSSNKKPTFW